MIGKKEKRSFERGIFWMLLSASCLSFSLLFLKINLQYISYFFLVFLRFFIPLLFIIPFILTGKNWRENFHMREIWLQLARATCVLVAQYSFAYYVTQNTLLNATVLLNASPLFIPLIEWGFLKRTPGKSTLLGALLSFFGVILVLNPDASLFTLMSGIGILAALGQAGSQVLYGYKSKKENLTSSLFYLFLLTSLPAFIIFLFFNKREDHLFNFSFPTELLILYLISMSLFTLLNQYYRGLAYSCSHPSALATFLYFSVFVSALFDWLVFKNEPTFLTIIGGCLIILGGVLKVFLRSHILKKRKKS